MTLREFISNPVDRSTLMIEGYFMYWSDGDLAVDKGDEEIMNLSTQFKDRDCNLFPKRTNRLLRTIIRLFKRTYWRH